MNAVILAAGKGSRLKSLTENTPKSLLKLNDENTLLDYNLSILEKLGIDQINIVTGFAHSKIEFHTGNRKVNCIYNPFWDHCNVLGSLYMALPYLKDDFLFLHADTLVDISVWEKLYHTSGDYILPYKHKVCGEEEMKVKLNDENEMIEISKNIIPEEADGEFLGIAKFSKSTLPYFQDTAKKLFSTGVLNHYMEAVIQEAINEGHHVKAFNIGDADFIEIDFEEDYLKAKQIFG